MFAPEDYIDLGWVVVPKAYVDKSAIQFFDGTARICIPLQRVKSLLVLSSLDEGLQHWDLEYPHPEIVYFGKALIHMSHKQIFTALWCAAQKERYDVDIYLTDFFIPERSACYQMP